jgi:putative colanic acid biosynthesis acetyltransferase WcaF
MNQNKSKMLYLCTGSHDWTSPAFDLIVRPITVESGAWLATRSTVAPGVTVGRGAVLALGSVAVRDLAAGRIHQGCPAVPIRPRPAAAAPALGWG